MPTSAPGSSSSSGSSGTRGGGRCTAAHPSRGFTLIELLLVIAIVALGAGLVALALPDGDATRLDEEGERLVTLLETARAESRVSGVPVVWVPRGADDGFTSGGGLGDRGGGGDRPQPVHFRFVGLHKSPLPSRWLDARVSAQVVGARQLVLGPSAILPPQRVVLSLGERRLELASDGLAPFAAVAPLSTATP
jgi:general secretion pathway protein H